MHCIYRSVSRVVSRVISRRYVPVTKMDYPTEKFAVTNIIITLMPVRAKLSEFLLTINVSSNERTEREIARAARAKFL